MAKIPAKTEASFATQVTDAPTVETPPRKVMVSAKTLAEMARGRKALEQHVFVETPEPTPNPVIARDESHVPNFAWTAEKQASKPT